MTGGLYASVLLYTKASTASQINNGVGCTTKQKNKAKTKVARDIAGKYCCTTNPTAIGAAKKKLSYGLSKTTST